MTIRCYANMGWFVVVLDLHLLLLLPHQLVRLLHLLQSSKSLLLVVRLQVKVLDITLRSLSYNYKLQV